MKHGYLRREMYYKSGSVGTGGRKDKTCEHCGKLIPKGQPHDTYKFYGAGRWPTYATHNKDNGYHGDKIPEGTKSCSELFKESLN